MPQVKFIKKPKDLSDIIPVSGFKEKKKKLLGLFLVLLFFVNFIFILSFLYLSKQTEGSKIKQDNKAVKFSPENSQESSAAYTNFSDLNPTFDEAADSNINSYDKNNDGISLLFGGDMMFDRNIRLAGEKKSYEFILGDLSVVLMDKDLAVANLEGPISDFASVSVGSQVGSPQNFLFTFSSKIGKLLNSFNIKLVSIGNNHINNFGEEGVKQTKKYLQDHGIDYFGDTGENEQKTITVSLKGKKISFVNYNQFVYPDLEGVIQNIKNLRPYSDYLIVYAHWGNEYETTPTSQQTDLAHSFIDAGADFIIGSHPHVVQTKEEYKGKMIYYSLGNMVFDQYFSTETQKGLLIEADINTDSDSISFKETTIRLEVNGQTVLDH